MNNQTQFFKSGCYQPNVFIAILLKLYISGSVDVNMVDFPDEKILDKYVNEILLIFTIENRPLIEITKGIDIITLTLKQNSHVLRKDFWSQYYLEIECKKYVEDYLHQYTRYLERDDLHDELINRESWETLLQSFINSVDVKCNLNDYKIYNLTHIAVISVQYFKKLIFIHSLNFKFKYTPESKLFDENYWDVRCTLRLKPFIRKIHGESRELKYKYSLREQQVLDFIENYLEEYVTPEELLDIIQPDSDSEYGKKKKYLSNFISRLNKKFLANTGYKRFSGKVFNDVYKIELIPEET